MALELQNYLSTYLFSQVLFLKTSNYQCFPTNIFLIVLTSFLLYIVYILAGPYGWVIDVNLPLPFVLIIIIIIITIIIIIITSTFDNL